MTTKIEWTDETWNPITGCSKISEGCQNCYAERRSKMLANNPMVDNFQRYKGFKPHFWPERLNQPLRWRKPRRIFVCSMGDLFHDDIIFSQISAVLKYTYHRPEHTFIVLTKRPGRMKKYFDLIEKEKKGESYLEKHAYPWPTPNLWLGVTAENQQRANERIPMLLQIPASVRFVSVEPMLGPINLFHAFGNEGPRQTLIEQLDWVICGGETGPKARPMHPDWVRSIKNQCRKWEVPFFFKSWGEFGALVKTGYKNDPDLPDWAPMRVGKKAAGRQLDGREWNEYPEVQK